MCVCTCTAVLASLCFCFWEACSNKHTDRKVFPHSFDHTVPSLRHTQQLFFIGHKPNHQLMVSFHSSRSRAACHNPFKVLSRMWSMAWLVGLPVMDLGLFDRWVYLSLTPLLQMMMVLQPLCHAQHLKQVGTHNNYYYFLIYSSSLHPLRMVAMEHFAYVRILKNLRGMLKWITRHPYIWQY